MEWGGEIIGITYTWNKEHPPGASLTWGITHTHEDLWGASLTSGITYKIAINKVISA